MNETVWTKLECPNSGARWTTTHLFIPGTICNFSGCDCGEKVKQVGRTSDVEEASNWFRGPATK